jgi:hypothetical protein
VDDPLFVRGFKRFGDLRRNRERFVEGNLSPCDPLIQALSIHEFEDEELRAIGLFKSIDRSDVRMVQRGEHLGFPLKSSQAFEISGDGVWEDLHRDIASEFRVARAIHLAHPARADCRQNLVRAETSAR